MSHSLVSFFSPGGPLENVLSQFEPRAQQLEMAEAIADCIRKDEHLLVEAGTGTGKSFAYLVPFILWAVENDKRVLVATYTKTLQHQLMKKDLPLLARALRVDFRYALCLGTQNYLCPRRLQQTQDIGLFATKRDAEHFRAIKRWAKKTKTGVMQELDFEPTPELWGQINRESDLCLMQKCPFYERSFYWKARRQQQQAHILIANHHLFFANLAAAGNVLPKFDAIVFDEAHNLEAVAADYLGLEVSNYSLHYLLDRLWGRRGGGLVPAIRALSNEQRAAIESLVAESRVATDALFATALDRMGSGPTLRIREAGFLENTLSQPLLRLAEELHKACKSLDKDRDDPFLSETEELRTSTDAETSHTWTKKEDLTALLARVQATHETIEGFLSQTEDNMVYWVEAARRARMTRVSFRAAPIDVASILRAQLFGRYAPIVLTSATLTQAGSFAFLAQRLGLERAKTLAVGSPFDFKSQVLLYIAPDIPEPAPGKRDFEQAAIQRALEIVRYTRGRAFVLCTSHAMVRQCSDVFERDVADHQILRQGEQARERLVRLFNEDTDSILIGTATFWQGIDVPGEALQCVIIMKLPFAVPDDPITEGRMEHLQSQDIDPFYNYQVPHAVLLLRQGFGRLIRHRSDYGLVAILDPRILSRRYGELFLKSLPECPMTDSLEDVEDFFAHHRACNAS